MVIKKTLLAAIALCAISAVGFAGNGSCASGSCSANGNNGSKPLVVEPKDHAKGVVENVEVNKLPNGNQVQMVVRKDNGETVNVAVDSKTAQQSGVRNGDRVSVHGRYSECNGNGVLRCEKLQRDGTVNLNQAVK